MQAEQRILSMIGAVVVFVAAPSAKAILTDVGQPPGPAPGGVDNAIVQVGDERGNFCTGTIIGPNTVLTAGHCVNSASELPNITPGGVIEPHVANIFIPSTGQTIGGLAVQHPDYSVTTFANDIALIYTAQDLTAAAGAGGLNLPSHPAATPGQANFAAGAPVGVWGFGSQTLPFGTLRTAPALVSSTQLGAPPTQVVYRVGGGGANVAPVGSRTVIEPGDSGGPGLQNVAGTPTVVSVHSFGTSAGGIFISSTDTIVSAFNNPAAGGDNFVGGGGSPDPTNPAIIRDRFVQWISNNNGNWTTAPSWSLGGVNLPATNDIVFISRSGNPNPNPVVTYALNANVPRLAGVVVGDTLNIHNPAGAADFQVTGLPGFFNDTTGTVNVGVNGAGALTGRLAVTAMDNRGALNVNRRGQLDASANSNNAGTLTVNGVANFTAGNGLRNAGTLTSTNTTATGGRVGGTKIVNVPGGLVTTNGAARKLDIQTLVENKGKVYALNGGRIDINVLKNEAGGPSLNPATDPLPEGTVRVSGANSLINIKEDATNASGAGISAESNGRIIFFKDLVNEGGVSATTNGFVRVLLDFTNAKNANVGSFSGGGFSANSTDNSGAMVTLGNGTKFSASLFLGNTVNQNGALIRANNGGAIFGDTLNNRGQIDLLSGSVLGFTRTTVRGTVKIDPSESYTKEDFFIAPIGTVVGDSDPGTPFDGTVFVGGDWLNFSQQNAGFEMEQIDLTFLDPETLNAPDVAFDLSQIINPSPSLVQDNVSRLVSPSLDVTNPGSPGQVVVYAEELNLTGGPEDIPSLIRNLPIDGDLVSSPSVTTLDVRGGVIYTVGGLLNAFADVGFGLQPLMDFVDINGLIDGSMGIRVWDSLAPSRPISDIVRDAGGVLPDDNFAYGSLNLVGADYVYLTPVPEPTTLAVCAAGVFLWLRRRSRLGGDG
jgi:Trypsin